MKELRRLKPMKIHKAIVGKRGIQVSEGRICGYPNCNEICQVVPVEGSRYEFNVVCPTHDHTTTISWQHALPPPSYVRITVERS